MALGVYSEMLEYLMYIVLEREEEREYVGLFYLKGQRMPSFQHLLRFKRYIATPVDSRRREGAAIKGLIFTSPFAFRVKVEVFFVLNVYSGGSRAKEAWGGKRVDIPAVAKNEWRDGVKCDGDGKEEEDDVVEKRDEELFTAKEALLLRRGQKEAAHKREMALQK